MTPHSPDSPDFTNASCPVPGFDGDVIVLGHGSGGSLTRELLDHIILPELDNEFLAPRHDGAFLPDPGTPLAFTTDSYVVDPIFFPGGDIGSLAVHGTVNDLAMCGAIPRWLSVGLVLEEGLPLADLVRIIRSMRRAADEADVLVVTGDTKVVERGRGHGIYLHTSGVGAVRESIEIDPASARPGDRVIVSGEIAGHGMAVLGARDELAFETEIHSDSASLHGLVETVLATCPETRVLRDPTRGGIAAALHEIATSSKSGVVLEETRIPIREPVRGACEILGIDPLYVANEGKLLAVVPSKEADRVLDAMRNHERGREAAIIGEIVADHPGLVRLETSVGGSRVVDLLPGDQLPRIC